jgi:hypothetical protein
MRYLGSLSSTKAAKNNTLGSQHDVVIPKESKFAEPLGSIAVQASVNKLALHVSKFGGDEATASECKLRVLAGPKRIKPNETKVGIRFLLQLFGTKSIVYKHIKFTFSNVL